MFFFLTFLSQKGLKKMLHFVDFAFTFSSAENIKNPACNVQCEKPGTHFDEGLVLNTVIIRLQCK